MKTQLGTFEGDASMLSTRMKLRGVRVLKLYKTGYLELVALWTKTKRFENQQEKSKKVPKKYRGEFFWEGEVLSASCWVCSGGPFECSIALAIPREGQVEMGGQKLANRQLQSFWLPKIDSTHPRRGIQS